MRLEGEPTVGEILASIKQVMARDDRAAAMEEPHDEAEDVSIKPDDNEKDVLDPAESGHFIDEVDDLAADASPLVNEDAQANMRERLAALAMLTDPGKPQQAMRSGGTSLEDLVREMLRPALAEWLEKNLPPLVERMVAAEIRRITNNKS